MSTTSANKDINLDPHGTGTVVVPSGYEDRSGFGDTSLANKAYVDQVAQGLDTKPSCKLATDGVPSVDWSRIQRRISVLTKTISGCVDRLECFLGDDQSAFFQQRIGC